MNCLQHIFRARVVVQGWSHDPLGLEPLQLSQAVEELLCLLPQRWSARPLQQVLGCERLAELVRTQDVFVSWGDLFDI